MQAIFKKVAVVGAIALSMGLSAANAASLGTLSGTKTVSTPTTAGSFTDLYDFSVAPNRGAAFVSTSVTFASYGASLSSLALYLGSFSNVAQLVGETAIFKVTSPTVTNLGGGIVVDSISGKSLNLATNTAYTLVVGGTSIGASQYTNIIALAPVPEPETYAMLLAGLGLMGFVARRRQKNNQA